MSTELTLQVFSTSSEETEDFGEKIAKKFQGGEIIELVSDLGGGKTTMVKGMVKGIGSADIASSPTFTVNKVYKGRHINISHYDFYRLSVPGLMAHEIEEVIEDKSCVVIIEWADVIKKVLPENRIRIRIAVKDNNSREINVDYPKDYKYIFTT